MQPFSGAVLAGGRSRRMGTDKAFVPVDGQPMAARAMSALREAGAREVIAVGGAADGLLALGFDQAIDDEHPGEGPLGGILTAFSAVADDVVVVLACDLAWAGADGVAAVVGALGEHDAAVPRHDRVEPLHAAWRRSTCHAPMARRFAEGERAVHAVLADLDVAYLTLDDPSVLRNVNRPSDLPG